MGAPLAEIRQDITRRSHEGVTLLNTDQLPAAGPLLEEALRLAEAHLGPTDAQTAACLNNLGEWHRLSRRFDAAEPLYRRALALEEAAHGPDAEEVGTTLNNLALLLRQSGQLLAAEPLYRRVLEIFERVHGRDEIQVGSVLNNLAQVLAHSGRQAEAEQPMRRALSIFESEYGPRHPNLGVAVNNLARLLDELGRSEESEPLARRQIEIFQFAENQTGRRHAYKTSAIDYYQDLLLRLGFRRRQAQVRLHAMIDGEALDDLSIEDLIDESVPDFDQLSVAANREGAGMEDQNRLFAATFRLGAWLFIARGDLPDVRPYVAANRSIAGGAAMVKAFTDSDRLRTFAKSNDLLDATGSVQMLSLPVTGVLVTLDGLAQQGVTHIHFNADECSDGYFVPLRQLEPIRRHLEKHGLL